MTRLLQLLKSVRIAARKASPDNGLKTLVEQADACPTDDALQVIGAYRSWVHGDTATARRLALRAIRPEGTAFPALLVLTATSAEADDTKATYEYAKQLATARRADKWAARVSRAVAGTGLLSAGARSEEVERLHLIEETHDQWVAWARDFVRQYEAVNGA
jgi:hypothetical protein